MVPRTLMHPYLLELFLGFSNALQALNPPRKHFFKRGEK
jgi:hypothetical protein